MVTATKTCWRPDISINPEYSCIEIVITLVHKNTNITYNYCKVSTYWQINHDQCHIHETVTELA